MGVYLTAEQRQYLLQVDDHRCAYCQTSQDNTGQPMVVDHIIPRSKGGKTAVSNLCFACRLCNEYKGDRTALAEPLTHIVVPFFHPRQHKWSDHFTWDDSGVRLIGLTAIGRVTVVALNMNNPVITDARRRWVSAGWHPPR